MNDQITKITNGTDKEILIRLRDYIKRYYNNHGKMPLMGTMRNKLGLNKYQLKQYIDTLKHQGFLKQSHAHYKPNNKKDKIEKEEKKNDIILIVLRVIMIIIGIGATAISIYYTSIWFCEFVHIILAIIFSGIMVFFSVGVFEVIIILKGNKQYKLIIPCVVLWIIVLSFSMVSTIAGQYNQRIENTNEDIIESSSIVLDREKYELLLKQEKELEERINEKKEELKPFMSIMSDFETIEDRNNDKWLYWNTHEKIKKINKDIEKLRNELDNKRIEINNYYVEKQEKKEEVGAVEETEIKKVSFYDWVGDIFKVESKYIEFFLSLFPALFVDIVAPFAIAMGMFLKRKKYREEDV